MKLASWNVNGIRSAWEKGLSQFVNTNDFDVICLQEIKAKEDQLLNEQLNPHKYKGEVFSAEKPGYSSVLTYSKKKPLKVIRGIGSESFDREGRVITLEYPNYFVVNSYFPNSQRDHARLDFKLSFCNSIQEFLEDLEKVKPALICGDFNIAHRELDLKNPKSNQNNAGFLPEEREWMDRLIEEQKYVDTFRKFESGGGHYTWWSYRPGVREKNVGWRLDYFFASPEMAGAVVAAKIHPDVRGSDHCPVSVEVADSRL